MGRKERDASIEVLRIVACLFVICIHISLGTEVGGMPSRAATVLACLRADAVALFWSITGAFAFRGGSMRRQLHATLVKIVVPTLLLIYGIFLFNGAVFGGMPVLESIRAGLDPQVLIKVSETIFLEWKSPAPHTGQLWYVFAYVIVMLMLPMVRALWKSLDSRGHIGFLLLFFAVLALNDLSGNQFASFSHHTFNAAIPAVMYVCLGDVLYGKSGELTEHFGRRKLCVFAAALFLVANLLRAHLIMHAELFVYGNKTILYWYSAFGFVCTSCLFLLCTTLFRGIRGRVSRVLVWLGSCTFGVYLLHIIVIDLLKKYGAKDLLIGLAGDVGQGVFFQQLVYYVVGGAVVFVCSLMLVCLLRLVKAGTHALHSAVRVTSKRMVH